MAKPGRWFPSVNGDEVRNTKFLPPRARGYDSSEVDELLRRVAVELDAGRAAGPLIRNARFRHRAPARKAYDEDAVDWFLEEFLRQEGQPEPDGISADPWRDLPVVNQFTWHGPGGLANRSWRASRAAHNKVRKYLPEECL